MLADGATGIKSLSAEDYVKCVRGMVILGVEQETIARACVRVYVDSLHRFPTNLTHSLEYLFGPSGTINCEFAHLCDIFGAT